MTAGIPKADPHLCPDCQNPIRTSDPACPHCDLPLRGPVALELWNATLLLNRVADEREHLLATLRAYAGEPPPAPARPAAPTAAPSRVQPAPEPARAVQARPPAAGWEPLPAAPPRPRREWDAKRVQNLLLSLGVLLLVVAAVIFAVVAWGRLGIGGRAMVLAATTAATGWGAYEVHRRELTATAEALGSLTLALLFLDAYAVRRLGLAGLDEPRAAWFWSGAVAAVAAISGAYASVLPLRVLRWSAAAGAQLPLPIALSGADVGDSTRAIALSLQTGAVVAAAGAVRTRLPDVALVAYTGAALTAMAALPLALVDAFSDDRARPGAAALVVLAAVAALAAWLGRDDDLARDVTSGASTALLLLAVAAVGRVELTSAQLPALLAASGLLAVVASAALPDLWRRAPMAVGAAGVALPVLAVAEHALTGLFGPYAWVERPWTLAPGASAREALMPGTPWGGTIVVLVVLLVAAATALLLGELSGRRDVVSLPVTLTVALAVLLVPLGQAWSYTAAIVWDVVAGAALTALVIPLRRDRALTANALYVGGLVVLGSSVAWSLASESATLGALAGAAVLLAVVAVFDRTTSYVSAGLATALGNGWVMALALSRGTPLERSGFFLALAGAACVVGGLAARRVGYVVAGVGGPVYVLGTAFTATDPGWLSWALATGAVAAGVLAVLLRDERVSAVAAGFVPAWVLAFSVSVDVPLDRAGFYVAATGAVLAVAQRLLGVYVGVVGVCAYAAGIVLTATDPGWLSWSFAAGAVAAVAVAFLVAEARPASAGTAAALACAWTYTYAVSIGTPTGRAGFCAALAGSAAVGLGALAARFDRPAGDAVEAVGATAYALAVAPSASDLGWLSWALALGGLTALADALRPERREVAWIGGALLSAWSWVRLWVEDVRAPEAYAAPVAATALILGHLRRRADETVGSWAAYGPGLSIALGPSLFVALGDPGLTRPLILGLVALAVVLWGARERLQAPLVLGGITLALDAGVQVAPYVGGLPRWIPIGAAGVLLVVVGVTFEQRRRDFDRLRDTFDAMT